ncbi:ribosomal protein S18-alanine N-acetyltransferase [Veronia pacifica]|uniref:[Ribosomal protein bS18]-alanine N-acetyltransferase n=1 Tax=Veronia pacifica TaxID=1080227 RepID=A0A1C3EK53_9GAMM|nr:ribosomal protein S18-alanine N-acetyltransferase [Veronia pacifica]ODA33609.1 ribosomal-protein-alanine N-acetyltransferase [Veronia pacifica]
MKTEFHVLEPKWHRQVIAIEGLAHSHPWSESLLTQKPNKFACNLGLFVDDQLAGYFFSQCIAGEASLLNIAVDPKWQGRGLGKKLLDEFFNRMSDMAAQEAWLEVRESNLAAIALYEKAGFNETDRRIDYYPSKKGKEDALVMCYWFDM